MIPVTPGRIVLAVILDGNHEPIIRPAIVVKVWNESNGSANLQVFIDGSNDTKKAGAHGPPTAEWATSFIYSEEPKPGTWHWPPRV